MAKELVFVPIACNELVAIDDSVLLTDRAAYHVTLELLATLECTAGQEEDAGCVVLVLTSVAALTRFGGRLVLVVNVDISLIVSGGGPESGACVLI